MNHDDLIQEIEATISTKGIGIGQTARALQVSVPRLRSILKTGDASEIVARAREIGLIPRVEIGLIPRVEIEAEISPEKS